MPRPRLLRLILLAVLCAAVLWLNGRVAGHHLPYLQYSNEASNVSQAVIVVNKGMEPISRQRPSLPVYLLAGVDLALLQAGRLTGAYEPDGFLPFPKTWDLGVAIAERAPEVVLINRLVCAGFGAGTVWLIFLLTRELFGRGWLALLAALFAAISGVITKGSIIVRPEIFMCFFVALALLGAVRIYRRGSRADYLWGGMAAGLACSSKYNAGLIVLSLVAAHLLSESRARLGHRWLVGAGLMSVVGFLVGTPYAAIDAGRFISDLQFELGHYQSGHLGRDGGDAWVYLRVLLFREQGVAVLALGGALWGLYRRSRPILILLAFVVPYMAAISLLPVKMDRHVTPVVPALMPCAAFVIDVLVRWMLSRHRASKAWPWRLMLGGLVAGVVFVVWGGLQQSRTLIDTMTGDNGRDQARRWIQENIEEGTVIGVESRGPWVDRHAYEVRRIPVSYSTSALWAQSAQWYADHGFEYLILSSRVQGLYRQNPERYAGQIAAYRELNASCEVVELFEGRRWGIAVLRIPDALRPESPPALPPWFVWAGPKTPHPIGAGEPWPVMVWLGGNRPPTTSMVGLSRSSSIIETWKFWGAKRGDFQTYEEFKNSKK